MNKSIAYFLLLFSFQFNFAQNSFPDDYFVNPLKIPISLSGNFGELRNNHFHSGLDIRTQQRTGLEVVAAAEGYVSRVKTSPWGYGNVIYVQHPNGYSTVYAHLDEFSPKIRAFIRERQYKLEKNEVEIYPQENEIKVNQGEVIAKSGNTGSSGGPHLHYEIRDARQNPLNPLLFGIAVKDTRPPQIAGLYVYPIGENSYANQSEAYQKVQISKQTDGTYKASPVTALGKLGFGIDAVDYVDGAPFKNGLYKIHSVLNGNEILNLTFDKFSYANTRYINRFIDFGHFKKHRSKIQKLFLEENNLIDVNLSHSNGGFVDVEEGLDYVYTIYLTDYAGNQSVLKVPIKGAVSNPDELQTRKVLETDYLAFWNRPNVFDLTYHDIFIPKNALYENTYLELESVSPNQIIVHHNGTPLHREITIGFDASDYSATDFEKLYVAEITANNRKIYAPTYKEGKRITTRTTAFGKYELHLDKIAPLIIPVNFKNEEWVSGLDFLKLKIEDKDSGIASYRGTINGEFVALEYDYKTGVIKYDFRDQKTVPGANKLKVIVVDNVGNSQTFEATFYRKD